MAGNVLVVEADLLALGRLEATAASTGATVTTCNVDQLRDIPAAQAVDLLVIDLDRGRERALEALATARAEGLAPGRLVAFVSHVDDELGGAARRAGVEAWPRGRFWRSLEELLSAH